MAIKLGTYATGTAGELLDIKLYNYITDVKGKRSIY